MTDPVLYCRGPGQDGNPCGRPVSGHGDDLCSSHRRQLSRTGVLVPIAEKLTPEERAIAAGTAMLEADSDEDYNAHRRAWLNACKDIGGKSVAPELAELQGKVAALELALTKVADDMRRQRSEEVKRGLSAARARGVQLGRPPKVSAAELIRLFAMLQRFKPDDVAFAMSLSRATVYRILKKKDFETDANGPRAAPESA